MTTRWPRLLLAVLLACTAAMYLWDLSASDYGNAFYAAAAQAGSQSWSAWFFGSLDAAGFITVDKPPAALWVTGLSVRLFGMNAWSVLVPQAVLGVAAVAVLAAAVRRVIPDPRHGAAAGLIAGAVLACTPAAALMFRFNHPDALLVLLLVLAAYCLARAVQTASWRWLALVGVIVGTAFLTKMLQAFLVLPGFGLAYLLAAPTTWRDRALHLAGATGALVVAAGWWVAIVQLIPAGSRPYVGGSTDDTVLDLAFGYNGLGRLRGPESERGGGPTIGSMKGADGPHRLFATEMANEISWLLPIAVLATAFACYLVARGRLDRDERAAAVSWGGWLLVTGLVFSYMHGTFHPYYTVALAPAVGALVGLGGVWAWRLRSAWDGRLALAGMLAAGSLWSETLLRRNGFGPSWLPLTLLVISGVAVVAVLVGRRWSLTPGLVAGTTAAATGTVAFAVATVLTPHHGAIPNAVDLTHRTPGPAAHTVRQRPGGARPQRPDPTRAGGSRRARRGARRGSTVAQLRRRGRDYESFTDKDALVAAVFDWVIADIAATTQAAVATAPRGEQTMAGVANLVRAIGDDARIGRLLFNPRLTHAVLARKRAEVGGVFALLSGEHAADAHEWPDDEWTKSAAHFVVGGVAQTISAWVSGDVGLTQAQLVAQLTRILDGLTGTSIDVSSENRRSRGVES